MLSDLGLHELASVTDTSGSDEEAGQEAHLAYALLSACIVYEGVWSLYLGRPSSIPTTAMGIAASRCSERRPSDTPWLNAWVGLCIPMADISRVLNEQYSHDYDKVASLDKLFSQVEAWYRDLPPELAYNEGQLTSMDLAGYGLHTQYCKIQILLRQALARPVLSRKRRYSQISRTRETNASSDNSKDTIYKYALRIARLVVTYREVFGVEKIPSIMLDNAVVAATAIIAQFKTNCTFSEMQQRELWLRHLVKSMETVQHHFPVVRRMLDFLAQTCGSGASEETSPAELSRVRHNSNEASQQDFSVDNIQAGSNSTGSGSNFSWDYIGIDTSSNAFDDFVFDFLPSGGLVSALT